MFQFPVGFYLMQQSSAPGGVGLTGIENPWYKVDSAVDLESVDSVPVANVVDPREVAVGKVFDADAEGKVFAYPFLASLSVGIWDPVVVAAAAAGRP